MQPKVQPKVTTKKWKKRGRIRWLVRYHESGRVRHSFFDSKASAEAEAARLRAQVANTGKIWNSLTASEMEAAIAHWRDSQKDKAPDPGVVTLGDAITALLESKLNAGRAEAYIANLRIVLNQFARGRETLAVGSVTRSDVQSYVDSKGPNHRRTVLAKLSTLFGFSAMRGYRPDNPCDKIERMRVAAHPITVLTVEQMKRCMEALNAPKWRFGLPWFVLSTFCGLRPEEAEKTTPADINAGEGWIRVAAQTSKVRQRRVVYPLPCASKLLASVYRSGGMPISPNARRRVLWRLREVLGLSGWPKDITRHTAASYWLAHCGSAATVAEALGHSESTLKRHYKALVTRDQAEQFWKLAESWPAAAIP